MTATTSTTSAAGSALVCPAHVDRVERISPAFVRVVLASPGFAELDDPGDDTRLKLAFPAPDGSLPDLAEHGDGWYAAWLELPEASRPPLRTYTIRDVLRGARTPRLVIDLVVHEGRAESLGPACRWALAAVPGAQVLVVGPRAGSAWGGKEFAPPQHGDLILVGDETAVPALTRVLAGLGPTCRGAAFLEVPTHDDVLRLVAPPGLDVSWVPRGEAPYGRPVVAAVRRHLGLAELPAAEQSPEQPVPGPDIDVWETPTYSASGEDLTVDPAHRLADREHTPTYAWIAGESWMVRMLRRCLVREVGLARSQVAFMGYWREGVAMRS